MSDRTSNFEVTWSLETKKGQGGWIETLNVAIKENYVMNSGDSDYIPVYTLELRADQIKGDSLVEKIYALRDMVFFLNGRGEVSLVCEQNL